MKREKLLSVEFGSPFLCCPGFMCVSHSLTLPIWKFRFMKKTVIPVRRRLNQSCITISHRKCCYLGDGELEFANYEVRVANLKRVFLKNLLRILR